MRCQPEGAWMLYYQHLENKLAQQSKLEAGLSFDTEWIERLIPFQDTKSKKRLFFVEKQGATSSSSRRECRGGREAHFSSTTLLST